MRLRIAYTLSSHMYELDMTNLKINNWVKSLDSPDQCRIITCHLLCESFKNQSKCVFKPTQRL